MVIGSYINFSSGHLNTYGFFLVPVDLYDGRAISFSLAYIFRPEENTSPSVTYPNVFYVDAEKDESLTGDNNYIVSNIILTSMPLSIQFQN